MALVVVLVAPLVFRAPSGLTRRAGLLCAPVGGGPPARRPCRELRLARRLEARPGPAAAHGHRSQALLCPPAPSTPVAQPEFAIQLVACGTVGVPGAVGPGRCVCRWVAARPLAVRAASLRLGASSRSPARPCHRPPAPRQLPPAPSTPVAPGVLMTIHIIAEPTPNSACNSPTTLSNSEIRSLELQRFLTLLKLHPIELHATFLRQAPPPPTGTAARPRHSPRTSEISRVKPLSPLLARLCVGLKPPSPLLAQAEPQLKPPSPLRAKRSCFSCIFRLQWCRRFQWSLFGGEQWCRRFHAGLHQWLQRRHWFQSWHVAVSCARKSSPSKPKTTENTVFRRDGRTFSRKYRWRGRAGRVFSRKCRWMGHAGRTFSRLLWQRSSF